MLRKFVHTVSGLILASSLLSGGAAWSQTTGYVAPAAVPTGPALKANLGHLDSPPTDSVFTGPSTDCAPGLWFNVDYLLWWMKAAPAPGPIVTTGDLFLDPLPGAIGQPNTRVLLGDREISNNAFSGIRLQGGSWIDEGRHFGFEGSVFALDQRKNYQQLNSDALGFPYLARPIIDVRTNTEDIIPISFPGFQSGGVIVVSASRFSGWDVNAAVNGTDDGRFRADGLFGFRAQYLREDLTIRESVQALVDQGTDETSLQAGERISTRDRYTTNNNFYGGQIGGRLTWVSDRLVTTAVVKLAVGVTDEIATISGVATTRNAGPNIGSGLLANPGNTGRYYSNDFSVIPEFNLNVGYRVTQHISLRAGYTFMYWSEVVRPGDVYTRAINPGLVPTLQGFGTGPFNVAQPNFTSSDFWTQGLNLGVEFRF
jgi:hypothetical protein